MINYDSKITRYVHQSTNMYADYKKCIIPLLIFNLTEKSCWATIPESLYNKVYYNESHKEVF